MNVREHDRRRNGPKRRIRMKATIWSGRYGKVRAIPTNDTLSPWWGAEGGDLSAPVPDQA